MQSLRSIAGSLATKAVQSSAAGKFEVAQLSGNAYKACTSAHRAAKASGLSQVGSAAVFQNNFSSKQPARFAHTDIGEPNYESYRRGGSYEGGRAFTYVMSGAGAVVGVTAAKNIVNGLIYSMSASADVLALAKVEVDLASLPEGKSISVMWRGKPLFIRHRTAAEIAEAEAVDISTLRDPETDAERAEVQKYLIMIGVCTHLGCIPVGEAGDYGGWFCPCHGSHYDISGRIRKGPAPLNLEIPPYVFIDNGASAVIG